jgi:MFS family permease
VRAPATRGLRANLRLFALLVFLNAFVGATVGSERTLVPLLGERVFLLASSVAVLSFVATFGLAKAFANLLAGSWAESAGRRRVLLVGWFVGLPVPLLLMFAPPPHWWLVLAANILLGVNQGLCWSMTVVMKVDLAGDDRRGLAVGLNEFSGYVSVGVAAFATALLADAYGLRPVPFLVALAAVLLGLGLTAALIPETRGLASRGSPFRPVSALARYSRDWQLLLLNQAGLVNNFNDGVAWGLFPVFFSTLVSDGARLGLLIALYPLAWGVAQLATGALSDRVGRKGLIGTGLVLQGSALASVVAARGFEAWLAAMLALGVGTAMVYPTLLGAVGDAVPPGERAPALGVYRFWRDLGFFVGAVSAGLLADLLGPGTPGIAAAIQVTAAVTLGSGLLAGLGLREVSLAS